MARDDDESQSAKPIIRTAPLIRFDARCILGTRKVIQLGLNSRSRTKCQLINIAYLTHATVVEEMVTPWPNL